MTKILLNTAFGGFTLSDEFVMDLYKNKYTFQYTEEHEGKVYLKSENSLKFRTDPNVIQMFEEKYPDGYDDVVVEEIDEEKYPNWFVHEYDGMETIRTVIKNRGFSEP